MRAKIKPCAVISGLLLLLTPLWFLLIDKSPPYSPLTIDMDLSESDCSSLRSDIFLITDELRLMYPCAVIRPKKLVELDEILILMMTGSVSYETRVDTVTKTFAAELPGLFFTSDSEHQNNSKVVTLPELRNRTGYFDAQWRQLRFLSMLAKNSDDPEIKADLKQTWRNSTWVFLVDDDTWINRRKLKLFTSQFDPNVPLVFGSVITEEMNVLEVHSACMNGDKRACKHSSKLRDDPLYARRIGWLAGGAGMLMTKAAAIEIGKALFHECRFEGLNDLTIGFCIEQLRIPLVHIDELRSNNIYLAQSHNLAFSYASVINALTFHNMDHHLMQKTEDCYRGNSNACFFA